ncbi:homoserine O-acetyltransferase MetX [Leptospira mayottensis]|uniref:Homoserine O-acetyltransferase n=2 Tax=Leptospira mayottensis TaxID=1137606 RepID=A0AA87MN08_9LEPT|nr:homoserine O-acetyltransferase [Leptospira mayottensis]AXR61265.1 homoserine O-acetyltransferase [Leptospira mayottensis]AXR65482.1 homoserine O-acetyltransferase [Leptospira mayottensis]AXR68831.1 homoserine O-acetyltransferase [Leptospira mayottensis]AZQ02300.1 homoserine O-acetyltransferase [Leptospira mayottensis 200901116]EKR99293.1 homoserine O-acetyltransferase [Leptospira mayottensis 200901122]
MNESGSIGIIETKYAEFKELPLKNGSILSPVVIAYETYGTLSPSKNNAILICHALSGDAHAAGYHSESDKKPGWWDDYIGPGKSFDTNQYFIICSNVIGGCKGSSGPLSIHPETGTPYGSRFPFVSIQDMVKAQKLLIEFLGIDKLFCVAGGSMGGMQALEWSIAYPDSLLNCIVMASAAEHSAMQIAFNEVGRQAILSDPNWNNGLYDENSPRKGLALARMVGHITYLSDDRMREKFGRNPPRGNILTTDFAVGSYLIYQGESFVDRFDANSYIYVTKALDHYSLGKGKELTAALSTATCRFLIVSYSSDWLYPPAQSREIVKSLEAADKRVFYLELQSGEGHDSFLLKNPKQIEILKGFLENQSNP